MMAELDEGGRSRWSVVRPALARAAVLACALLAAACVPVDDGYGGGYSGYGYGGGYAGGPVYSRGYDGRAYHDRDHRGVRNDHSRDQTRRGDHGRDRDVRGQQHRTPASGPSPRTFWNVPPGGSPGFGGPSNPGIN
jgi:hypothetical protein